MPQLSGGEPSSELLYLLYRATLDWSSLEEFLERASIESRAHNVCMIIQDNVNTENSSVIANREGREAAKLYPQVADHNPYLEATREHIERGKVLRTNELVDDKTLINSSFYDEYCRKADIHHCMGVNLRTDDSILVGLSFNRTRKHRFTLDDQRWAEKLAPHLQTFMTTNERLAVSGMSGDAAWAVLDMQRYGIQVFDATNTPVFVNQAMRSLVESSSVLCWRGDRLDANSRDLSNWLGDCGRKLKGSPGFALEPMVTSGVWDRERYQFMFAPLIMRDGYREQTYSVLVISDLSQASGAVGEHLADAFELTPRESEVAMLLVQGLSSKEIARRLGIAESTVVSHKKSLFQKTDVHKQSELVRLALSFDIRN